MITTQPFSKIKPILHLITLPLQQQILKRFLCFSLTIGSFSLADDFFLPENNVKKQQLQYQSKSEISAA